MTVAAAIRVCELLGLDPTQLTELTITFRAGGRIDATARFNAPAAGDAAVDALAHYKVVPR